MKALDLGRAARLEDRAPLELPEDDVPSSSDAAARRRIGSRIRLSDVDRHVSRRIRERRIAVGLTQYQLAPLVGVTYQQFHRYEVGANRISAGRLYDIGRALGVDVGYFFVGLEGPAAPDRTLTLELSRAFLQIHGKRHQEAICLLVRLLAEAAAA